MLRKIILAAVVVSGELSSSQLHAQEVSEAAPAPPEQTSEVPSTPEIVSPLNQVSPDDFTLRGGAQPALPIFDLGRRMQFIASVLGGYDDNVNLTPTGSPSWFIGPAASFSYLFGSSRLAFTLLTTAGLTYYLDHPGGRDYDPNIQLRFSLAYKATPRLTLNFSSEDGYQSQPDFSSALSVNRRLGAFFRTLDHLAADYRFTPRFSTITSYSFAALEYESSEGSLHDRTEHTFGEAARYLLFPTTTTTAEYRLGFVDFASGGANSTTHSFLAGIDQSFSPRLTGLLRGGVQFRSSDVGGGRTSPYAEATVHYIISEPALRGAGARAGELGSFITWSNRYAIEESDLPGGFSRETFRTNLELAYAITARIGAALAVSYLHGEDQGGGTNSNLARSSSQDVFDIAPTIRYALTPHVIITAGYRHSENDRGGLPNQTAVPEAFSFSRNRYFAGVNITF